MKYLWNAWQKISRSFSWRRGRIYLLNGRLNVFYAKKFILRAVVFVCVQTSACSCVTVCFSPAVTVWHLVISVMVELTQTHTHTKKPQHTPYTHTHTSCCAHEGDCHHITGVASDLHAHTPPLCPPPSPLLASPFVSISPFLFKPIPSFPPHYSSFPASLSLPLLPPSLSPQK